MGRNFVVTTILLATGLLTDFGASPASLPHRAEANPSQYAAFHKTLSASEQALHATDRLTFGARPVDLEAFRALGRKRWIDEQLHPERTPETPQLQRRLEQLASLQMTRDALPAAQGDCCGRERKRRFARATYREQVSPRRAIAEELAEAKLMHATYSKHQLVELLDDFWYNHFNVFLNKGADRYYVPAYERDAIRPHVLGKFYDLLVATAESPAMLFYLDNWQSVGPEAAVVRNGRKRGLNENYGRELLEPHTLGVDGGYTQADVINVARCFTGWTIATPREGGGFEYKDKWHDKGPKLVLGHLIQAGGGMNDGLEVLRILARQPATAHFISWKLARRFVADDPPPSLVNRMAETFLRKDGDLREVIRTMLQSREFWSEGAYRAKLKTPFELIASLLRVTDADIVSIRSLNNALAKLGGPLYRKVEPTGYSSANADWVSSAGLLARMNLALALTHNQLGGVQVNTARWSADLSDPIRLANEALGHPPGPETTAALEQAASENQAKPVSFAPDERMATLLGLVLGSPDFQRH